MWEVVGAAVGLAGLPVHGVRVHGLLFPVSVVLVTIAGSHTIPPRLEPEAGGPPPTPLHQFESHGRV